MKIKKFLKYLLPVPVKKLLKFLIYSAEDFKNFITGKTNKEYPPKKLNFVGSANFKAVGDEFFGYFKQLGNLKSTDTVLDIGSGIGRMAIPLKSYLTNGEFYGFDIDKRGIEWCQKNISQTHKNFHFEYVDIYNKYYNKKGKIKAEEFEFPYEDKKFDFIFATSVFTHMLPDEVVRYFSEIKRVLKKDGKVLLTFFSIDEEAKELMKNGLSKCNFKYKFNENCLYSHKSVPEAETAYKEEWILKLFEESDLKNTKIHHGSWSGRKTFTSYQDILTATKNLATSSTAPSTATTTTAIHSL